MSFAQFGEWVDMADMPQGKHHPVTFALDGYGYAVTGSTNNGLLIRTNDFYRYDPVADAWSTLSPFPGGARSFAIGQAYKGKGYLGFGASISAYLNDIWEYDPQTEEWDLLTQCPCAGRRHPAFVIEDDKIFVGFGDNQFGNQRDWWIYDMINDTWEQGDDLPAQTRHHPFMFSAGGEVYAGFGHGDFGIYRNWFRWDRDNEEWETMNIFQGEARVAGTQFFHDSTGYVLSGDGSDHSFMPTGEFWRYDHVNDDWEELEPHPGISRWAPGSFVIEDTIYFMGGQNRQTGLVRSDGFKFQLVPDPIDTTPPAGISANGPIQTKIYPNPSNGIVNVQVSSDVHTSAEIYSLDGRLVTRERFRQTAALDLNDVENGIYVLRLNHQGQVIRTERLVIQH
jgi:N-acetylneuraminic acid mutarotase